MTCDQLKTKVRSIGDTLAEHKRKMLALRTAETVAVKKHDVERTFSPQHMEILKSIPFLKQYDRTFIKQALRLIFSEDELPKVTLRIPKNENKIHIGLKVLDMIRSLMRLRALKDPDPIAQVERVQPKYTAGMTSKVLHELKKKA